MNLPEIGKIDREIFDKVIFPRLGAKNENVLLGPQHGVDAAVVMVNKEKNEVMVIAEDPTFGMPVLLPYFGWGIVHICASDIAVLGIPPNYMTICLMLPPGSKTELLESIWKQIDEECKKLGISIIGGHTGVYPGISFPLNGGCTMIGIGNKDQLTPPSNAKLGDKILMTKGPAVEAVGILAIQEEEPLKEKFGNSIVENAKKRFFDMSVVEDALTAAPNAHAMHDATEGGLLNGIFEIAEASKLGCTIYEDKIIIPEDIQLVCEYFGIDPLISISEGTLVLTCSPEDVDIIQQNLKKKNIDSWEIGEITKSNRIFVRKDGKKEELTPVKVDPFWNAYFKALEQK
ncbi:MAG: AIR synthase family protein [Candidatus Odinarchaeia archaeon]